jgi:hypothetical protein
MSTIVGVLFFLVGLFCWYLIKRYKWSYTFDNNVVTLIFMGLAFMGIGTSILIS